MSEQQPRSPYSSLRSWLPATDDDARERARALLDAHVAAAAQPAASRWRRRLRRPRSRGGWIAVAGATLVVAGAGAGVAALITRTAHTGHLPVYTAQGTLSPEFHVGSRATGYCFTASLATAAGDAYRCIAGNAINDPCFAPPHPDGTVACFIDPWHPVTLLSLDRPLPRHGPVAKDALPWVIETTDGRRCVFLTGATAPMANLRINYGCTDGSYLIGGVDRRNALWTIHSASGYRPDVPGHPAPLRRYPPVGIRQTIP